MTDKNPGLMLSSYIDDVVYPDLFHRETTPMWLTGAATALGHGAPDLSKPYTWMELGCGAGLGVLLAAAANPMGQFIGVDLNHSHIALALARAREAGLDNVCFVQDDFVRMAQAPADDGPACDFIVLHGVYSWVSEATRQAIFEIVRRRLKRGGLLYLAYMSHPGPAAFVAVQRAMRLHAQQASGSSDARALAALQFVRQLAQAGVGHFSAHPRVTAQLEQMALEAPSYLAHEFLNENWQPLHVADVMMQCAHVGCSYIGSATLLENIDAVSVPERTQPLLRTIADPALAETVRDLARNQSQRRDIYQRTDGRLADHVLPAQEHRDRLLAQKIAPLPGAPERGPFVFDTRIGPVEAADAQFMPLLQALRAGPQYFAEFARLPAYAAQPGFLNQAFQMLYWAGWAHPVQSASTVDARPSWRLNQWLSEQGGQRCWLAAPALGSALPATPVQGLAARALMRNPTLQHEALVDAVCLLALEVPMEPSFMKGLRGNLAVFKRSVLPWWQRYGVVPHALQPYPTALVSI